MKPRINRYVTQCFGASTGGGGETKLCPGEENCEKFLATAGKTRAIKEKKVCFPCPLFLTKIEREQTAKAEKKLENILNSVKSIFWQNRSGYPIGKSEMTAIQYNALVTLNIEWDNRERDLKIEAAEMFKAILKRF